MAKVCPTKVMINSTITSVTASEAMNSTDVSRDFSSFVSLFSGIGTCLPGLILLDQPERAIPAGDLRNVGDSICKMEKPVANRRRRRHVVQFAQRPIYDERPPNHVFLRHEPPVPAVRAVVAIV